MARVSRRVLRSSQRPAITGRTGLAAPTLIEPLEDRQLLAAALTVTSISTDNRGQAVIQFNKTPDVSTLTQANVLELTAGADGKLGTGDDVAVAHTIAYTNGYLYVTGAVSTGTPYRIVLRSVILSTEGANLSGNYGPGYVGGNFDFSTTTSLDIARFNTPNGPLLYTLDTTHAPNAVASFKTIANAGTYDGTIVHASLTTAGSGLDVLESGGFNGVNYGTAIGPDTAAATPGSDLNTSNVAGSLAFGCVEAPNFLSNPATYRDQFYMNTSDNLSLDGKLDHNPTPYAYTVFGHTYSAADDAVLQQLHTQPTVVNATLPISGTAKTAVFQHLPTLNSYVVGQPFNTTTNAVTFARVSVLMNGAPTTQITPPPAKTTTGSSTPESKALKVSYITCDNRGQVVIKFNKAVDPNTITQANVLLFTAGGDGTLGTLDDTPVTHDVGFTSGNLTITATPGLAADTMYRVVLRSSLRATDGAWLSGNTGTGFVGGNYDFSTTKLTSLTRLGTPFGPLLFSLNGSAAPKAYANFKSIADNGCYDGTIMHRREASNYTDLTKVSIVQSGAWGLYNYMPAALVTGSSATGGLAVEPRMTNIGGTIALGTAGDTTAGNTASEFYINAAANPSLDGKYTVFGYRYSAADDAVIKSLWTKPTVVDAFVNATVASGVVEMPELPLLGYAPGNTVNVQDQSVMFDRISMLLGGAPTKQVTVSATARPATAAAAAVRAVTPASSAADQKKTDLLA